MTSPKYRKVLLLGLDSWSGAIFERLVAEGALPNIERLMARGSYGRLAPFWNTTTGNNWTSISTGASPAIHQCDFKMYLPGHRLDQPQFGFPSQFCKAEQIWQVASREGLTSVIIDYPQSFPVNAERVIHIGEDGHPDHSLRAIFRSWAYATNPAHRNWASVMSRIELRRPQGWQNLSASAEDSLEGTLELQPSVRSQRPVADRLHVLLEKDDNGRYARASLFQAEKDYARALGTARKGQWTDWIVSTLETTHGPVKVGFRAKLLELDPAGPNLHLYLTQGYPVDDFTVPAQLSNELLEACGPYQHVGHNGEYVFYQASDLTTHLEEADYHGTWFRKAACHVLEHHDWDLLVLKWHDTDIFQHIAMHMIDPVHPLHDPSHEAEGWDHFRRVYGLGDQMVGALVEQAGEEAIVAVVSDHGQVSNTYFPDDSDALAAAGLCAWTSEGTIDIERSKVLVSEFTGVHINLKGRYEGGIVEPGAEYEAVRKQALEILRNAKHPHTGDPSYKLVAYKEDLAFMGLGGPQLGDIIFMINPVVPNRRYTEEEYEQLVMGGQWLTSRGTHGPHLPSQQFSVGSIDGVCVLAGPGVRAGRRAQPTWTNSVAPTLSYLSGLPVPRDADGGVIRQAIT